MGAVAKEKTRLTKRVDVTVHQDHLRKISKTKPIQAVEELIWNSLDADATEVQVIIELNEFYGIREVRVEDNGAGMTPEFAEGAFETLGGSWKKDKPHTQAGRKYRGKDGQGRFTAFSIGGKVSWTSTAEADGKAFECMVTMNEDNIDQFHIEGGETSRTKRRIKRGTVVTITDVPEKTHGLIGDDALAYLQDKLALYLVQHRGITITHDGTVIDPEKSIAKRREYDMTTVVDETSYPVKVEVIEWLRPGKRGVYLCGTDGASIMRVAGGGESQNKRLTAHVKSEAFDRLQETGRLQFEELDPVVRQLVGEARDAVESYSRETANAESVRRISEWKQERVYPFENPPATPIETAQQEAFDVLANEAETRVPEIRNQGRIAKRLFFRLLRDAVEHGPDRIQAIFAKVLELNEEQQADLTILLGKTSLSAIISSAKIVTDRLEFLTAFEMLVHDYRKELKERGQLQKLLEANAWIFGEEFSLAGAEVSLKQALRHHASVVGEDIDDAPVESVRGKKVDIIDLFLTRSVPLRQGQEYDFLVVEIKRPSRTIDISVFQQTVGYATAMARDPRFYNQKIKWSFWMVGVDLDPFIRGLTRRNNHPAGRVTELSDEVDVDVWAFTWSELIHDCRARMEFFRKNLDYAVTEERAWETVGIQHADFVHKVIAGPVEKEGIVIMDQFAAAKTKRSSAKKSSAKKSSAKK
jgi:hypothetical protein